MTSMAGTVRCFEYPTSTQTVGAPRAEEGSLATEVGLASTRVEAGAALLSEQLEDEEV